MKAFNKKQSSNKGQILISILVAIAIFSILIHALFTLISSSFNLVSFNRARTTAKFIALERMELVRNLPYSDIGTVDGIPSGILQQEESITINGLSFTINTNIVYIDDDFDDLAPDDILPTDYKRVRIEVSWGGIGASKNNPVLLITDISPRNLTQAESGGTLLIQVINAYGIPVNQASVSIMADSIIPPVNLNLTTNSEGIVSLPGATPCNSCYRISATKDGHTTDRTHSTAEVTNPNKPDATVIEENVTQVTFSIDQISTINITSFSDRESGFTALGSIPFRLRGAKTIGTDAFAQPVYKYDELLNTNASGSLSVQNMEWDVYNVYMPDPTSYDISGTSPVVPINLLPNDEYEFTFANSAHSDNSLLVTVKDDSQDLVEEAYVKIAEGGTEHESTTGLTDDPDFGQVFFSSLQMAIHTIEATASGFLNYTNSVDISEYTLFEIIMTPE